MFIIKVQMNFICQNIVWFDRPLPGMVITYVPLWLKKSPGIARLSNKKKIVNNCILCIKLTIPSIKWTFPPFWSYIKLKMIKFTIDKFPINCRHFCFNLQFPKHKKSFTFITRVQGYHYVHQVSMFLVSFAIYYE